MGTFSAFFDGLRAGGLTGGVLSVQGVVAIGVDFSDGGRVGSPLPRPGGVGFTESAWHAADRAQSYAHQSGNEHIRTTNGNAGAPDRDSAAQRRVCVARSHATVAHPKAYQYLDAPYSHAGANQFAHDHDGANQFADGLEGCGDSPGHARVGCTHCGDARGHKQAPVADIFTPDGRG